MLVLLHDESAPAPETVLVDVTTPTNTATHACPDVPAAPTVLGRRARTHDRTALIDLDGTCLTNADLRDARHDERTDITDVVIDDFAPCRAHPRRHNSRAGPATERVRRAVRRLEPPGTSRRLVPTEPVGRAPSKRPASVPARRYRWPPTSGLVLLPCARQHEAQAVPKAKRTIVPTRHPCRECTASRTTSTEVTTQGRVDPLPGRTRPSPTRPCRSMQGSAMRGGDDGGGGAKQAVPVATEPGCSKTRVQATSIPMRVANAGSPGGLWRWSSICSTMVVIFGRRRPSGQ